jgi:hypothetical protein
MKVTPMLLQSLTPISSLSCIPSWDYSAQSLKGRYRTMQVLQIVQLAGTGLLAALSPRGDCEGMMGTVGSAGTDGCAASIHSTGWVSYRAIAAKDHGEIHMCGI